MIGGSSNNFSSTVNPAFVGFEHQHGSAASASAVAQQRNNYMQQRPTYKPLLNFASTSTLKEESNMQRDSMDTEDSYFFSSTTTSDIVAAAAAATAADNEPISKRSSPLRPQSSPNNFFDNSSKPPSPTQQAEIRNNGTRKSITPPPTSFSTMSLPINNNSNMKPPASSPSFNNALFAATSSTPAATTAPQQRNNLMDRMKERHRQEVRRSLNTSPFSENPTPSPFNGRKNLSSPSMPIIFTSADNSSAILTTAPIHSSTSTRSSPSPPRTLVQSQSFTTYASSNKPPSPPLAMANNKRQSRHIGRSVSLMNDMYGNTISNEGYLTIGTMPIQVIIA